MTHNLDPSLRGTSVGYKSGGEMPLFGRAERQPDRAGYVLLVDDEPSIRESVGRALERAGYRVRVTASVSEALSSIGPDLHAAILDVILVTSGGRSGLDVLAEIRQRPWGAEIPVLMLTGYGLNPDVERQIELGGAELLHKPVSLKKIVEWLDHVMPEDAT